MAPTNTAIEWVSGRVGRYRERRMVGASPDRAVIWVSLVDGLIAKVIRRDILNFTVLTGKWSVTGF